MLSETYPECEYVVQYRQTDLAFVSRLLESVGIYYYFEHEPDKHTLVMLDAKAAHEESPKCEALPYFPPDRHHDAQGDYVRQWRSERALAPRTVSLSDYNFLTSLAQMQTHAVAAAASPSEDREVFDYPGGYADSPSGNIVDTLELKCGALSVKLDSKAGMISVAAGNKFEVNGEEISLTGAKKAGMTGGSTASVDLAGAATVKGTAVNLNS